MKLTSEANALQSVSLRNYPVDLPEFQGPFDLFLKAIDEEKIQLTHVPISEIVSRYIRSISDLLRSDWVTQSEFIALAACLLELKSRWLLPTPPMVEEEEEIFPDTLAAHLETYRTFQQLSDVLRNRQLAFEQVVLSHEVRNEKDGLPPPVELEDVSLSELTRAFSWVWERLKDREAPREIIAESLTVDLRIQEILDQVEQSTGPLSLESLFSRYTRLELVVTFVALLELARRHQIQIAQDNLFGKILITRANGRTTET